MPIKLEGGGSNALVVGPLVEELFYAASLSWVLLPSRNLCPRLQLPNPNPNGGWGLGLGGGLWG